MSKLTSVKGRFMGRYGSREQALAALDHESTSHHDANVIIKNPNLTREDLHSIATGKATGEVVKYWKQHAHNEYFSRYGEMPK